jgi:hypothetical protein
MACSVFTSKPAPSQADIEKEEQVVYSFFVSGGKGPALILENTATNISKDDAENITNYVETSLPSISNDTLKSFQERNTQPGQLSPDMQLGVDYVLLNQEQLSQITSQSNWNEVLADKYPGSNGYMIFSRVGFNKSLTQAVLYVGEVAGPLMGAGYYYLLEKQNGEWVIKEQVMIWIS